nr:3-phosphoshikimate 1-carboxyvinyltransferase [Candidatus Sigynarchaeota archaeon]
MKRPSRVDIQPIRAPFDVALQVPGSKSITNRALIIAALSSGESLLRNALFSDDTEYMIQALLDLGIDVSVDRDECTIKVVGQGGNIRMPAHPLSVGNSGTCMRFLASVVTLGHGTFTLDGNPRMRERPIKDLIDGLRMLGIEVAYLGKVGFPPVEIKANGFPGGATCVKGDISSQYISSILLSAPLASSPVTVTIDGNFVSRPYVAMTTALMQEFGATVSWKESHTIEVRNDARYSGKVYTIESDYSSASYFMAAAALTGSKARLGYLPRNTLQGDGAFARILVDMGAKVHHHENLVEVTGTGELHAIDIDMFDFSDLVPTVAVLGAFARGTTCIKNVGNIRFKESDRLHALATELTKIGATIMEHEDGLEITGMDASQYHGASIDTYDDHRIAMAFSIAGLKVPGIWINNPACITKTYPRFLNDLDQLY